MKRIGKELKVNTNMRQPSVFRFKDLTEAWHGFHDYMFNREKELREKGGTIYGSELVSYDNFFYVDECTLDPEFNFGKVLGYKTKKWSKLINNYVNLNYLDLVKHEVIEREIKRGNSYNFTYRFDNSHGSGKDCLIALNFCRRKGEKKPTVIFMSRASEWTKRVAFDFLLCQRIVEYVYGDATRVQFQCYLPFIFVNLECSLMYVAEFGSKKVIKKDKETGEYSPFQLRLKKKLKIYETIDTDQIKYKVHQRAARQVQRDKDGRPIANVPDLFARDLDLTTSNRFAKSNSLPGDTPTRDRPQDTATGLETYRDIKKLILASKGDEKLLTDAMVAIKANRDFFWPKGWDPILLKRINRESNKKWLKKTLKLIVKYT
jgi:hypothetical protein